MFEKIELHVEWAAVSECVCVCVAGGLCVRQSEGTTVEGLTQDYIAHRCESECNLGASMTLSIFLLSPSRGSLIKRPIKICLIPFFIEAWGTPHD